MRAITVTAGDKLVEPDFSNPAKALKFMRICYYAAPCDVMDKWIERFLNISGVFEFLLEEVKKLEPLRCVSDEFPLMAKGEGYDASDFGYFDDSDPRSLLLEYAPRVTGKRQLKLFDVPGAEAYFVEIAKCGVDLYRLVQERLLGLSYGGRVFRMYAYQGGKLCPKVKERYTVGDLLYGV